MPIVKQSGVISQKVANGGFQSAEAEIVGRVVQQRAWKIKSGRVSVLRQSVDDGAGGVGQTDEFSYFVKAFSSRIIESGSQHRGIQERSEVHQHGVPATDHEGNVRLKARKIRYGWRALNPGRVKVGFMVVNSNKRPPQAVR